MTCLRFVGLIDALVQVAIERHLSGARNLITTVAVIDRIPGQYSRRQPAAVFPPLSVKVLVVVVGAVVVLTAKL